MNGVPSTLHRVMKYVYDNKVYKIEVDPNPNSCLKIQKNKENPLKTLTSTTQVEPMQEQQKDICPKPFTMISLDDLGSFNFEPTFMGEYKIINEESGKGKEKVVMSTKNLDDPLQASTSTPLEKKTTNYTIKID